MASQDGHDWVASFINETNKFFLVAIHDNQIIGYLQAEICDQPMKKQKIVAHLCSIHVLEAFRHRKIGAQLTTRFFELSKQMGARRFEVGVVTNNPNTIAFYKRMGFTDYLL